MKGERDKLGRFIKGYSGSPIQKGHKINLGKKCSKETRKKIGLANSKPKIKKICGYCNKSFYVWPSQTDSKFCSKKCTANNNIGKPSWNKGLKGYQSGEKHHNWKGGITPINIKIRKSTEYKLWRKAIFERDKYTCIWCGQKGKRLNADHIKPFSLYPELRFAIDNGRILCINCHKKTNTWGVKIKK